MTEKEQSETSGLPALSPGETEILALLWQLGRGTVQQVCNKLPAERQKIAYATVQTLLRRLEKKGYVIHEVKGKAHVFVPAARREDVISRAVGDFVDRLFGGDPVPLLLHLARYGKLDAQDIERLRKLTDKDRSSS